MGLLSHSMEALSLGSKSRRSSGAAPPAADESPDDTSTLDKDEGNILMALIAQLRPGMDLTKIALPTFVLEPRSLLERITDFFSHPEFIIDASDEPDAEQRFMSVLTFYLSGWHIKPRGVKKPYNPVLNEFFRCAYYYEDGSTAYYVAEQVSHHPPISAFCFIWPKHGIFVTGELKPKSRFLGNSAATMMEGEDRVRFLRRPEDGEYQISMPNTYARGILFGKMVLELGDNSTIKNETTGFKCDVDFKTKGWISGGYNQITGHVKGPNGALGELAGAWSGAVEFTGKKGGKRTLFDAPKEKAVAKSVLPESEQEEYESRRLWTRLTDAIRAGDQTAAQEAKSEVEEHQRGLRSLREQAGQRPPEPRFFKPVEGDKWMPKLDTEHLPTDVAQLDALVRKFIFNNRVPGPANKPPTSGNTPSPTVEVPPVEGGAAAASTPTPTTTAAATTPAQNAATAPAQNAAAIPGQNAAPPRTQAPSSAPSTATAPIPGTVPDADVDAAAFSPVPTTVPATVPNTVTRPATAPAAAPAK